MHLSLEPDVHASSSTTKLVADDWKDGPNQGHRHPVGRGRSWSARATRRTSRAGTTWSSRASRSSPRTRPRRARRSGTSSRPTATCSPTAAPRPTPQAYLTKFFDNVVALPGSGRDATTAFQGGTGDVLLSYENEAILARQSGADFDYVVPDADPADREPGRGHHGRQPGGQGLPRLRQLSKEGQTDYAEQGFRPLDEQHQGRRQGRQRPERPVPDAEEAADHRRRLRRLGRGEHEVLRRERRHRHQDPGGDRQGRDRRCRDGRLATASGSATRRRRRRRRPGPRRAAPALGLGVAMIWFSLLVLIPLAAVVVDGRPTAAGPASGTRSPTRRPLAALRLTVGQAAAGHAASTW